MIIVDHPKPGDVTPITSPGDLGFFPLQFTGEFDVIFGFIVAFTLPPLGHELNGKVSEKSAQCCLDAWENCGVERTSRTLGAEHQKWWRTCVHP